MSNLEQYQDVIAADDLADVIDLLTLQINDETLSIRIDPRGIYCAKTGTKIGIRDEVSLFSAIKSRGKNDLLFALYNAHGMQVDPAWLFTDNVKLDLLQQRDPIAYCCYCFSLATKQFYDKAWSKRLNYASAASEQYWSLARANALLQTQSLERIRDLSIALCHLLTYAPETLHYIYRVLGRNAQTPDKLALMQCSGELMPAIEKAVNSAFGALLNSTESNNHITRRPYETIPVTPGDMAKGPSQIRLQAHSKRGQVIATSRYKRTALQLELESEIERVLNSQSVVGGNLAPEEQRGISKFHELDLSLFASLDILATQELEDLEDDDNEVIIRTIPRSIITGKLATDEIIPQAKKSSLLDRIAPKALIILQQPVIQQPIQVEAPKRASLLDRLGRK